MVDMALRSYFLNPASKPKLANPDKVHEAISGLKVGSALKHLPQQVISLLFQILNVVLRIHHFPTVWKYIIVISILKPQKDPALPSFYQPISLFDTFGK
jgi:hypothetical protein